MKNVRTVALVLSLAVAGVAAAGCSGATQDQAPQTSASAATKAPVAPNAHGFVKVVGAALGEVPLRPDQRTELEKLAADAEARHAALAVGHKELMLAVADQVEAGAIDRAALQPKIDRVAADFEKARPQDRAALARVHAILDPDQRNAFVDALTAKMKAHHHGRRGHGRRGHHARRGEGAKEGNAGRFGGMRGLAAELKLTDAQRAQIKDTMKESWKARREQMKPGKRADLRERIQKGREALESFRTDHFDPNAFGAVDARATATRGADRILSMAEKVLPILTPEQRTIAAKKLRDLASSRLGEQGPPLAR